MKFVNYIANDKTPSLYFDNAPRPTPRPSEVLIKVHAFGVNRADLLQCAGHYPPPEGASEILGLECSGVVCSTGKQVGGWKEGDKVCGLVDGGAYAEYCVMDAGMIWQKSRHHSWAEAAALPEAFLTAYQALFTIMDVTKMRHVLIHAAASGVGSAAIRLARDLPVTVWGTSSADKHAYCLDNGYDAMIDYNNEAFSDVILKWTDGQGVDGVLDFVGGPYFQDNIEALALDGKMVMLGTLGGVRAERVNVLPVLSKRLTMIGSTLRSRNAKYKRELVRGFLTRFGSKIYEGNLRPSLFRSMSWQEVNLAHQMMHDNQNSGKIALLVK